MRVTETMCVRALGREDERVRRTTHIRGAEVQHKNCYRKQMFIQPCEPVLRHAVHARVCVAFVYAQRSCDGRVCAAK